MNNLVKKPVCDCPNPICKDEEPFFYQLDLINGSLAFKTIEPYTFTMRFGDGSNESKRDLGVMLGFPEGEQVTFTDCWQNDPSLGFNPLQRTCTPRVRRCRSSLMRFVKNLSRW